MTGFNPQQQFPGIPAPFVEVVLPDGTKVHGRINQIWLQLLIALWKRTGAGPGSTTTDGVLIQALMDQASQYVQGQEALLGNAIEVPATPQDNNLAFMALLANMLGGDGSNSVTPPVDECGCCVEVVPGAGLTITDEPCGSIFTNAS